MKGQVTLKLSHPYKRMRERPKKKAEGKTTLLGIGWIFPHCHWADGMNRPAEKSVSRRGMNPSGVSLVTGSAAARLPVALVTAAIAMAGAVVMAVIAVVAPALRVRAPRIAGRDESMGRVNGARRTIHDRRRRVVDGWRRAIGRGHHHRSRVIGGRVISRPAETDADRPTGASRGRQGGSEQADRQSERFDFHSMDLSPVSTGGPEPGFRDEH